MNTVIVSTKASIVVEGMIWEIEISTDVEALNGKEFVENIKKNIGWLFQQGFRPTGQPRPDNHVGPPSPSSAPMPQQTAMTDFIPNCTNCPESPMRKSKVQEKEGKIMWYCPKKPGGDYCKVRASTDANTGEVNHWAVKK